MPLTLPVDGQTNWGDELNAAVNQAESDAQTAITNGNSHAANIPADPHGDRAYTQSLVNPIFAGANLPNGFVQLNSAGFIPPNLYLQAPAGGLYTNAYDVVAQFKAPVNTGQDCSVAIQNALNAASAAGGGMIWFPPGVYSMANYVVIGNNTWVNMSPGAIIRRIVGLSTPAYLMTNILFGGTMSQTPSSNIWITGGQFDAVGPTALTANCTLIFLIQATNVKIDSTYMFNVFNNPCIEINGCTNVRINEVMFDGVGSSTLTPTVPACRLNYSFSNSTPPGLPNSLYNGTTSNGFMMRQCGTNFFSYTHPPFSAVVGSDVNIPQDPSNNYILINDLYVFQKLPTASGIMTINWDDYAIGITAVDTGI